MDKLIRVLFVGVLLISCNSSNGMEFPRDQFKNFELYGKVLAGTMIQDCEDAIVKKKLTEEFKDMDDDADFLLCVQKEEYWPVFRDAYFSIYDLILSCTEHYLPRGIVDRLRLEWQEQCGKQPPF
jgi:hypothetical protein